MTRSAAELIAARQAAKDYGNRASRANTAMAHAMTGGHAQNDVHQSSGATASQGNGPRPKNAWNPSTKIR